MVSSTLADFKFILLGVVPMLKMVILKRASSLRRALFASNLLTRLEFMFEIIFQIILRKTFSANQ